MWEVWQRLRYGVATAVIVTVPGLPADPGDPLDPREPQEPFEPEDPPDFETMRYWAGCERPLV
ncbi:MAG: hypothetical protein ACRBN8_32230 [Nannocystales bacterium]